MAIPKKYLLRAEQIILDLNYNRCMFFARLAPQGIAYATHAGMAVGANMTKTTTIKG